MKWFVKWEIKKKHVINKNKRKRGLSYNDDNNTETAHIPAMWVVFISTTTIKNI